MSIKEKLRAGGRKTLSVAMSAVLAVGLMPLPAFASDYQVGSLNLAPQDDSPTAMSTTGLVTAAAHAAANPAPEILGLSNMNQRDQSNAGVPEWEVTYNLFGDPDVNSNPNPYLYNHKNGLTPGVYFGGFTSPDPASALKTYGSDSATNNLWNQMPMVVLGTGSTTIPANEHDYYNTASYARAVEKANGKDANSYNPIAVTYDRTTLPTMITTMYRLAAAADEVIAKSEETSGTLSTAKLRARYTDPAKNETVTQIAQDYERYVLGAKGLVKQAIDTGKVKQGTYAYVKNYNASAKTFTLSKDGVEEGTATTSRYVEAVQGVATNVYETYKGTATAEQLKNVGLIIVNPDDGVKLATITDQLSGDLLSKTYYCDNWANGSSFGTTVNSVENAQNIGRILPGLYPGILDQSDMIAFYYDVFYHVKSGKKAETDQYTILQNLIGERMDGVRNWEHTDSNAYTEWNPGDITGYDQETVRNKLKAGVSYLNKLKNDSSANLSSYLTPTNYLASDVVKVSLANATVQVPSVTSYNTEPTPVVKYGSTTLTKGTDYEVTWTAPESSATKGSITVAAKSGSETYEGSKTVEYSIVSNADLSNSTVTIALDKDSSTYTGKGIEPSAIVTLNGTETPLVEGADYIVDYENNTNVAASTAASNAPTVKITGIGAHAGTATKTFSITKAPTTLTNSNTVSVGQGRNASTQIVTELSKNFGDPDFNCLITADDVYDGTLQYEVAGDNSDAITCANGVVKVVKPGTATLKVTALATNNCEGNTEGITLTITVNKLTPTIGIGAATDGKIIQKYVDSSVFNLNAYDNSGASLVYTYASSNQEVATVDNDGKVTFKQADGVNVVGTTKITVSTGAVTGGNIDAASTTVDLVVSKYTPDITVANESITKSAADGQFSIASTVAKDENDKTGSYAGTLSYSSSNVGVATVDASSGQVTIKAPGKANLVVTAPANGNYQEATKTIALTVNPLARTINASDKTVAMGETVSLGAALSAGTGTLSYKPANASVATVGANGVVTPVKAGTTTVTISAPQTGNYAAVSKTVKVTVTQGKQAAPTFKKQTKTVKFSKLKKKAQTVSITKAKDAKTTVTYSISKVNKSKKKFSIAKKTGKIKVKKGTKKGTYKVTVKATAANTADWASNSKTAVITIKVK